MKKLAFIISLIAATPAMADELSVIGHSVSKHVENHNFNEFNYGFGLRYSKDSFGYQAGAFKNSINKVGTYGLFDWSPLRYDIGSCLKVETGVFIGTATGYLSNSKMPAPIAGIQAAVKCGNAFARVRAAPDVYLSSKGVAAIEIGYTIAKF